VGQDGTSAAQTDRLEANPLTVLPKFKGQEASQSKITKVYCYPLHHGGLPAAGGTGQEKVLEQGD
jgi:hypothetical protein